METKKEITSKEDIICLLTKACENILKRKKNISMEQLNGNTVDMVFDVLNRENNPFTERVIVQQYARKIASQLGHGDNKTGIEYKLAKEVISKSEIEFKSLVDKLELIVIDLNEFFKENNSPKDIITIFRNLELAKGDYTPGADIYKDILPIKNKEEAIGISNEYFVLRDYLIAMTKSIGKTAKNFKVLGKFDVSFIKIGKEFLERINLFISVFGHDIKTPLNPIFGFSDMINKGEIDEESVADFLEIIKKQIIAFEKISKEIIPLSRKPKFKQHELSEDSMIVQLDGLVENKTLNIELDNTVYTDIFLLETIIRNIAGNSLKFVDPITGKVDVKTKTLSDDVVKITMNDNGPGFPADTLEKINNFFSRKNKPDKVDSSIGSSGEVGTGKGLRNCEIIARRIGVYMTIESSDNGTVITIYIPTSKEKFKEMKRGEFNIEEIEYESELAIAI